MPKRLSRPRASVTSRSSSLIQNRFPIRAPNSESPRFWGAATRRFSRTVSRANSDGSWKVRTSPRRARVYVGSRVMSSPSNRIVPLLAGSVPATTAMNVDLPAPFGPIKPVIFPLGTASETPSTACMPSKWRLMSSATSIRWSGCADIFHQLRFGAAFEDVTGLGPDAFGPEPEKAEDEQPNRDPLERRDDVWRSDVHPDQLPRDLLEADRHEQGAEDGTEVVAPAADDQRGEQNDRLWIQPGRRSPHGEETDQDRARKARDGAADHEHCHFQRDRILAQRGGRQLVLAHGAQRAAVRRVDDSRCQKPHEADADRRQRDVQVKVGIRVGVDLVLQRLGHKREASRAVEERTGVVDHCVRDDRRHQQRDGLIVAAQLPQHHEPDRDRKQAPSERPADPGDRERQLVPAEIDLEAVVGGGVGRHREDGGGVRAGCLEHDEAEVDDARNAELEIEGEDGDDVDARVDQKVGRVVRVHPAAASAPRFASSPCGRRTMTRTRTPNATTSLYSGDQAAALSSVMRPMITAPIIAPYGWPAPPRTAAASAVMRKPAPLAITNESEFNAAMTPARPQRAPVMSHTMSITRCVGMPQLRASVGLAAVARIALPRRV